MILISDIGNTSITAGIYDGDKKVAVWRLATDCNLSCDEYGTVLSGLISNFDKNIKLEGAIVASVVTSLTDIYINAVKKTFEIEPVNFSYKIDAGIKVVTENQSEVGADRIVNTVAAVNLYGTPSIVIDMGTATTFDIVNENKEFIGGIIIPGMKLQTQSLYKHTSKLPLLDIEPIKNVIGHNTQEAILSGVVRGHACMIEGLLKECEKELGSKPVTIATGGYAHLISGYMEKPFDFIDEDLTLKGLNIIYHQIHK